MFFLSWVLLIAAGLLISLGAFFWAFRNGQFSDQERARYLPLVDGSPLPAVENPARVTKEVYALLLVIGLGLAAMIGTIALTLVKVKG
jgi:cbb3-type cytochrome oxidase maturation protein